MRRRGIIRTRPSLIVVSEDATGIKPGRVHDAAFTGRVIGPIPFSGEKQLTSNGFPHYDELKCNSLRELQEIVSLPLANLGYVYVARVAATSETGKVIAITGTKSEYTADEVVARPVDRL